MDKVNQYIDRCIIDDYATNYSLDVSELPKFEIANVIDLLLDEDSALKDTVLDHIQHLIDDRLYQAECNDKDEERHEHNTNVAHHIRGQFPC